MSCYQHDEGFFYYMAMPLGKFKDGKFAACLPDKKELWNKKKRPSSSQVVCECANEPFCFQTCITEQEPISGIDLRVLFDQVYSKLKGRLKVVYFAELSASQKRWCFYWYYAVNYFHIGGCELQKLPNCFVSCVRASFPDPEGQYTGYRTQEERQQDALDKM